MLTRLLAVVTLIQLAYYVSGDGLQYFSSHACGSDHEDVQTLERSAVVVHLAYRPPVVATSLNRRIQAAFVTVGDADAAGATARIRIHVRLQCSGWLAAGFAFFGRGALS
jgi:hypothetical protein